MSAKPVRITTAQARTLALRAQGLDAPASFGLGKEAVLRAIEHLGYVQIDTLAVVERAHHHVLWSRVPDYKTGHLDALHTEASVYEYWGHAISYLPMRDYRYSLPMMRSYRDQFHWANDTPELRKAMKHVLARIRKDGALMARDFESTGERHTPGVWSSGKIEKRALHELCMRGVVMVARRTGFQKTYDLAERVLPAGTDLKVPSPIQMADHLLERALRAHGLMREAEMRYLQRSAHTLILRKQLAVAIKKGTVVPVQVEEATALAYARPEALDQLGEIEIISHVSILSPFDNLVIQRERLRWLFNFDYQIECYVTAAKRRYGHFVLPVLWGDRFAARLEAKRLTKESRLTLTGLWFEPGYEGNTDFHKALREALERFAIFNACQNLDADMLRQAAQTT